MKRPALLALIATIPVLLIGTVWQTSRYSALETEARRLESSQEDWVEENGKLIASIAVLSSRERIAAWAEKLGLAVASPERRIHVLPPKPVSGASHG
jgi:cell division protein FtsL